MPSVKKVCSVWGFRHSVDGSVDAVAFSPDGKLVLTGSYDDTVRLWEVAGGRLVATLSGHKGTVKAVAFSPDGWC